MRLWRAVMSIESLAVSATHSRRQRLLLARSGRTNGCGLRPLAQTATPGIWCRAELVPIAAFLVPNAIFPL